MIARGIGVYATAAKASAGFSLPIAFASEGYSSYYISYAETASDYLQNTALSFAKKMKQQGIVISAAPNNSSQGKPIMLTTSASVNGWKIDFAESGAITVTGKTEQLTAVGFLHLVNVLVKKGRNGDYL